MTTPETIRSLITTELRLKDLPMNLSFHEAGLSNNDFQRITVLLNKKFQRTVATIKYSDTVYTLTDRFNGK